MTPTLEFNDYRDYLQKLVEHRDQRGKTRSELAKAMGCQAAYFSQVLKGQAELTEDHAIKLCQFLELNDLETEYFMVLLRMGRAGTPALAKYLEGQRVKLLDQRESIEKRVASGKLRRTDEMAVYYTSSWIPSLVHIATSCEGLQTMPDIALRLGLSEGLVDHHLHRLEAYGLVKFENGRWSFQGQSIHIPKNSSLDAQFQMTRRLLAMNSVSKRKAEDLHYSVVFSTDEKTFKWIKNRILEFVEGLHKEVDPTPGEDVFSVCLDSFRV